MGIVAPYILWITPNNWSSGQQWHLKKFLEDNNIKPFNINFIHLAGKYGTFSTRKKQKNDPTKSTVETDFSKQEFALKLLDKLIDTYKPEIIVLNNEHFFKLIADKRSSLNACRGSTFFIRDIPVVVMDYFVKLQYSDTIGQQDGAGDIRYFRNCCEADVAKLYRFATGTTRRHGKFVSCVATNAQDIYTFGYQVKQSGKLLSFDIETNKGVITCVGFSCLLQDGTIGNICIPFVDPTKEDGCYWNNEKDEVFVWNVIKEIMDTEVPKTCQNGVLYDTTFFLHYGIPVRNLFFDTYTLIHAIWAEMPRSLGFICSLMCDYYFYWKDETDALSAKDDKTGTKIWIPQTREGLEQFWKYNQLDCYWTLIATIELMDLIPHWAWNNYIPEFHLQVTAGLHATCRGTKLSYHRQEKLLAQEATISKEHLEKFKVLVPIEEFNPMSYRHIQNLIYDILLTKPLKAKGKNSGKSTDKKVLEVLAVIDPLVSKFVTPLLEHKEAQNNISKYGPKLLIQNRQTPRFLYQMDASGTGTTRFSSSRHPLGYGSNKQNIPKELRDILEPDKGYIFYSRDYSQSDFYYTAYYLQDPAMMEICEDERDTHCLMAEYFFNRPYDEIFTGYLNKEDWVVHATKGVRQNQKRISYGANYLMAGTTLYVTMGHSAVIGTALAMGYSRANGWGRRQIIHFCDKLIEKYWEKFHTGMMSLNREIIKTKYRGGLFIDSWNRHKLFLGNPADDGVKRKIAAEIGQSGTAGAINRALLKLLSSKHFYDSQAIFLGQTHDDIKIQIPLNNLDGAKELIKAMHQPLTIEGKEFAVPCEGSFGFSWGKGMVDIPDEMIFDNKIDDILDKCIEQQRKLSFLS